MVGYHGPGLQFKDVLEHRIFARNVTERQIFGQGADSHPAFHKGVCEQRFDFAREHQSVAVLCPVDGFDAGAAGALWQACVFGFARLRGLVASPDVLQLDPHLPDDWAALRFPLSWAGQPVRVEIDRDHVTLTNNGGRPLSVRVGMNNVMLEPGQTQAIPLTG